MSMVWTGYRLSDMRAQLIFANQEAFDEFFEDEAAFDASFDVDKAWEVLHVLLTGSKDPSEDPLSQAIFGGRATEFEYGYGPAMYLTPDEVKRVAAALSEVGEDDLRARYDPKALAKKDVYPGKHLWRRADPTTLDEYVLPYFRELKTNYAAAAAASDGMLTTLS